MNIEYFDFSPLYQYSVLLTTGWIYDIIMCVLALPLLPAKTV